MGDSFELRICKDTSGVSYGYTVFNVTKNEPVIEGDGYSSEEEIISDIRYLAQAYMEASKPKNILTSFKQE
jgi:hypothetical protein